MLYSHQRGRYFMILCRRVTITGPVNREILHRTSLPCTESDTYDLSDIWFFFQRIYLYFTLTAAIVA